MVNHRPISVFFYLKSDDNLPIDRNNRENIFKDLEEVCGIFVHIVRMQSSVNFAVYLFKLPVLIIEFYCKLYSIS